MTSNPDALTITVTEAAALIGIGRATAYDLVRTGEFPVPVLRIGRRYRVPKAWLEAFLSGEGSSLSHRAQRD